MPKSRPVTIEQTSKIFKAGQLLGGALIIASLVACVGGGRDQGMELLLIGLIVWLGSRMGAWCAMDKAPESADIAYRTYRGRSLCGRYWGSIRDRKISQIT